MSVTRVNSDTKTSAKSCKRPVPSVFRKGKLPFFNFHGLLLLQVERMRSKQRADLPAGNRSSRPDPPDLGTRRTWLADMSDPKTPQELQVLLQTGHAQHAISLRIFDASPASIYTVVVGKGGSTIGSTTPVRETCLQV